MSGWISDFVQSLPERLTVDQAVEALSRLKTSDAEGAHIDADEILLRVVDVRVADAYRQTEVKARGFWFS